MLNPTRRIQNPSNLRCHVSCWCRSGHVTTADSFDLPQLFNNASPTWFVVNPLVFMMTIHRLRITSWHYSHYSLFGRWIICRLFCCIPLLCSFWPFKSVSVLFWSFYFLVWDGKVHCFSRICVFVNSSRKLVEISEMLNTIFSKAVYFTKCS